MTTKLSAPLKREIDVGHAPYTLTITPEGFTLVPKGRRKGYSLTWEALVSGEAALAVALNASLANAPDARASAATKSPRVTKKHR